MKNLAKILRFALPYKGYVVLNIAFNLLAVVFSLFSITMLIPFLDLIFLKKEAEYNTFYANGPQELTFSIDSLIDNFNFYLSKTIVESSSLDQGKFDALILLCIIIGLLFFFKNLFGYLALFSMAKVRMGVLKELRENTFAKLLHLPLSYYSEERKGDIISRLSNDVIEIEWSVLLGIEMIFREPVNIILFLGTMVYMSPELTVFVFILLPVTGLVIGKVGNSLKKTSEEGQAMSGQILSTLEETLSGLRIIKAFNAENKTYDKYHKQNVNFFNLMVKVYRRRDLASPLSEFFGIIILIVILWFGGKLVLSDGISASVFIAFTLIFSQIIAPAKGLSKAWYNVQRGAASADRLGDIINAPVKIKDKENAVDTQPFSSEISLKDVWFKYGEDYVLKGINLTIKKGETIALVGSSGGGKSTLADLIPRFHDVEKGDVVIDGKSIKELTIRSIRNQLGVVTQQSILFNDTIFNNIAFGVDNVSKEEVEQAAKVANAHNFISGFPNGYDTNIGDGGSKLSGGQKQRISIARAVLKNPPILILDEATSALDTESEKLVQNALNNLMKNRTSLVIAHRLSTIQNASRIIVLEEGKIVESGTHSELLERKGTYFKLSQLQSFD
ncbi:MAG: antibiotic ABC transporter ATP-binding protein [Crocinitomicaceae bacterium]|nr:antibiotic ABC transporter ATP-binding protein [Crocinitomicaceae bacterium]